MKNSIKFSTATLLLRLLAVLLAVVPFIFWQPFGEHFYTYLTGTVITEIITRQWHLVVFFILLFGVFIVPLSYRKRAKWADYGLVGAFFVSLFIEMYGIPLSALFASKYLFVPGAVLPPNVLEFEFLGVGIGMDHAMVYGAVLMTLGLGLITFGWRSLYNSVRQGNAFAAAGLYRVSRHPQYLGFFLLIIGWFFGWPTILTVIFSPILLVKYWRAARAEEKDMLTQNGEAYREYMDKTPFLL